MGDRANIVIRANWPDDLGSQEAVFLYSHWGGTEMPETLRAGLARSRGRWNDAPYLARMLTEDVIGEDRGGETGVGVSTRLGDNEYPLLILFDRHVHIVPEDDFRATGFADLSIFPSVSFDEYVEADEQTWDDLKASAFA